MRSSLIAASPLGLSAKADPRVEERVTDVDEQVDDKDDDKDQCDATENDRVVTPADGGVDHEPDAGPVEHGLGQDRTREHGAQVESDERDDRDERVLHLM